MIHEVNQSFQKGSANLCPQFLHWKPCITIIKTISSFAFELPQFGQVGILIAFKSIDEYLY